MYNELKVQNVMHAQLIRHHTKPRQFGTIILRSFFVEVLSYRLVGWRILILVAQNCCNH